MITSGVYRVIVLALCFLGSCTKSYPGNSLSNYKVMSSGHDAGGEFCSDFHLNGAQAAWFFDHATTLTATQQHNRYNYLPCWVRGTVQDAEGIWQWEIRAGGTARLIGADGTIRLFGCDDCEEILQGNEELPQH